MTSGSKGIHLYAALPGKLNPDETSALAKEIAEELQREHPKLVTATMTKARRSGKVFLDWSQNAGSKTTLTPYSLRGRDKPTVATPLSWAEVEAGAEDPLDLEQFRYEAVLERVDDLGDLFGRADARAIVDFGLRGACVACAPGVSCGHAGKGRGIPGPRSRWPRCPSHVTIGRATEVWPSQ